MSEIITHLNQSIGKLKAFLDGKEFPIVAICTGTSGPKGIISKLEKRVQISFEEIHFHKPGAEGHVGIIHYGYLEGVPVLIVQGRLHYFEGVTIHQVVHVVRTLCLCGIDHFIFTNAVGALREGYNVGDIVFIRDQVNNMGNSPLRGFPHEFSLIGEEVPRKFDRFVDMRNAYDPEWLEKCEVYSNMHLKSTVYTAVPGPEFETSAEVEKYSEQADTISMSIVPEVIASRPFGVKVLGISLITNLTGAIAKKEKAITHEDNLSVVERRDEAFTVIIEGCVKVLVPKPVKELAREK